MARWAGCSCFCQFQHREHWSKQNVSCFVWIFMMAFFCSWGQKWSAGWFDLTMSLTQGLHMLILCSLITQVQLDQGWIGNLAYWTFSWWDDTLWGQYKFFVLFFFATDWLRPLPPSFWVVVFLGAIRRAKEVWDQSHPHSAATDECTFTALWNDKQHKSLDPLRFDSDLCVIQSCDMGTIQVLWWI